MTTITIERELLEQALDAIQELEHASTAVSDKKARDAKQSIRAALAAPATAPAWHDAPNAPGDWVIEGKGFKSELQKGISQQEIDRVSSWPGRWYGPIPPDGDKP